VTWLEVENNVELTWGGSVMMGERGGKQEEKTRVTVTRFELPSLESSDRNSNATYGRAIFVE